MAVYVDSAQIPYRGMLMSHMYADTTGELEEMAYALGINPIHIQYPGTYREHYDICESKRKKAIKLGAFEVSSRFLVRFRKEKLKSE